MDLGILAWGDTGWGDELARGVLTTVAIASAAYLVGAALGTLLAAMKLSGTPAMNVPAAVYTTTMRGIPEMLVIYLVFFGGGALSSWIASSVLGIHDRVDLPSFAVGVVCIALSVAAYACEVIRGAVLAVPGGQIEAAEAVGMTRSQRNRLVVAPQAFRMALPGMTNVWQFALKDTALVSIIGVTEVMRTASIGSDATKQPFTFYFAALVIFIVIAYLSQRLFVRLQASADRGVRWGS
ncbi:MAG: octopine/nopaline transport system permease [Beijerinckiaceae bacterium]|nr:MAG: octopine/nopaline transport system permease [Beijerinckiaceae bacterium]